jgi:myo-inositol 2-dehydrogenase/D-chiro-inositol 1-dehydrogenase
MRFALLGADARSLDLADAVVSSDHALVAAYDVGPSWIVELEKIAPAVRIGQSWESLLQGDAVDALIVAPGDSDQRADQLRILVQAGVPMIVVHPVHESMLVHYELDMNRQESECVLLPYVPELWHPAIDRLAAIMAQGASSSIGVTEQIVFERSLDDRSKSAVLATFARDVEPLRRLGGEITRIGAMASRGTATDYANLGIQMSGPSGMLMRWSVGPVEDRPGGKLILVGQQGKAILHLADDADWTLETRVGGKSTTETFPDWDGAAVALAKLEHAIAGTEVRPTWIDAARDMELTDAIERSITKGRNIDLHFEEHTEQGTFKGMMAATGCLVLLGALALVIVATTAVNLNIPLAGLWPYGLLAVLVVFLLLQLLKFAFPKDRGKSG